MRSTKDRKKATGARVEMGRGRVEGPEAGGHGQARPGHTGPRSRVRALVFGIGFHV